MQGETKFLLVVIAALIATMGVGYLFGDAYYLLRIVQRGNLDGLYMLVGVVVGITLRDTSEENSILTLVCVATMAISGLLANGIEIPAGDSISLFKSAAATILPTVFFTSLLGALMHLFLAVKDRHRKTNAKASEPPRFVRTPLPKQRR